uniref:Minor capsid protein P9 transmembrane helices domain-containing protein n=1 Tax=viral metagenome TaxID=1070528 RepID=A0A6C0BKH1_9ZZZZ
MVQKSHMDDPFWGDQISILWNGDRAIEFFPTQDMNDVEKLNALTRFFMYLSLVLLVIYRNYKVLFIGIVAAAIIYLIQYNQLLKHAETREQFDGEVKKEFGLKEDVPIKVNDNGDVCQLPTPNNPFMNVLLTDYTDNPNRPPACNYNDSQANETRDKYFNYNLYKDVEDVWDRRNSQREYVTLPGTTIPNDRDSFMKWCWKTTYVCKDGDLNYCLQDEDLRVPGWSG